MSEFNFKSRVCSSIEQSNRLLALGLKKETADCYLVVEKEEVTVVAKPYYEIIEDLNGLPFDAEIIPAWSLHRLLYMLPDDAPKIFWILDGASITIEVENDCNTFFPHKGDIYKSVVDCIEWLIKEGYFNKEYLV